MNRRRIVAGSVLAFSAAAVFTLSAAPAQAGPPCGSFTIGDYARTTAKFEGPNAGKTIGFYWIVAPGAPNSPGQAQKYVCGPGNN